MKKYTYDGNVLTEDMRLSPEWWDFFLNKWKRSTNSPSLQCISNLCGNMIGSSQCGVVLRRGYTASFDTSITIIEIAVAVGYIKLDERKFLYNAMKSQLLNNRHKKKPSDGARHRIMEMADE